MQESMNTRELDQLVAWGGRFLRAASVKSEIMELLIGLGYSDAEHKLGWELYLKMLGYRGAAAKPGVAPVKTTDQLQALEQIDRFDEPAFRRATAALSRLHPEQYGYVFGDGLSPKNGPESLGSVISFLDRYAALRDGTDPNRAGAREVDHAAAATLEARGIVNPEMEQHLRGLVEIVKQSAPQRPVVIMSASEESLQAAAKAFAAWLHDWRTTASVGIVRRDYRIMLGISRRRTHDDETDTPETDNTLAAANATSANPALPTAAGHA
jgi:hypothetical protein